MIRSLIKWAIVIVIAVIGYNYFFGDEQEQKQSQEIIQGVGDIGVAAYNLIQDEIQRAKEGKYDDVVNKIQSAIDELKGQGDEGGKELEKLQDDLDATKRKIDNAVQDSSQNAESNKSIKEELSDILQKLKDLDVNN